MMNLIAIGAALSNKQTKEQTAIGPVTMAMLSIRVSEMYKKCEVIFKSCRDIGLHPQESRGKDCTQVGIQIINSHRHGNS